MALYAVRLFWNRIGRAELLVALRAVLAIALPAVPLTAVAHGVFWRVLVAPLAVRAAGRDV